MSRNASGTYSLPAGNPVVTNEVISSAWANTTLNDVGSALTDSLSRTGLGGMTSPLQHASGAIGAPAITFSAETTLGWYRAGAGDLRLAIGGSDILRITSSIFTYNGSTVALAGSANTFSGDNIFSGSNTFTKTFTSGVAGPLILTSAQPVLELDESDAAANTRRWWVAANLGALTFSAANDARTALTPFLTAARTGTTVDSLTLAATTVAMGASNLTGSGTGTWTGPHTFSNSWTSGNPGSAILSAAVPMLEIDESDSTANNRRWWMAASSEQLIFSAANDARTSSTSWMTVDRTTSTIDRVTFPTSSNGAFVIGVFEAGLNSSRFIVRTATSSTGAAQFVNQTAATSTIYIHNQDTATDNIFATFLTEAGGSGTVRGSIDFNRAGVATRYNTTCDGGLKENILDSGTALTKLRQVRVRSFRWINEKTSVSHGFIAQEVLPIIPESVSVGNAQRAWGMDFSKLVPLMFKAIQELDARLTAGAL